MLVSTTPSNDRTANIRPVAAFVARVTLTQHNKSVINFSFTAEPYSPMTDGRILVVEYKGEHIAESSDTQEKPDDWRVVGAA